MNYSNYFETINYSSKYCFILSYYGKSLLFYEILSIFVNYSIYFLKDIKSIFFSNKIYFISICTLIISKYNINIIFKFYNILHEIILSKLII